MIKKWKKYTEYRKNRKAAIRAAIRLAAALLPAFEGLAALLSNTGRVLEILKYMAELTPEEIRRILTHAAVETMPDNSGNNTQQLKGR